MLPSLVTLVISLVSWNLGVSTAATLLQGATIIAFDSASSQIQILQNSSLLIDGDRIAGVYSGTDSANISNTAEIIDASEKIISPGFIDTHHHLWQTAFKSIASNTTLAEYFQRYGEFGPSIQYFTPEDKYLGQLTGALELLHAGTTTVLDHAHGDSSNETADATLNATLDSGIRAYYAYAIHTLPNYTFEDQVYKLQSLADDERMNSTSLVQLGLAYDLFSSAPTDQVHRVWDVAESKNLSVVTTHYLGGPWTANNSPAVLNKYGMLNTTIPIVFSHASFIDAPSVVLLRSANQYISTTPESEFHYGQGHPYAYLIQDQAALGLDTHFTYSTTMVGQARMWLQNLRARQYQEVLDRLEIPVNNPMSVQQVFHLITRAGALALRRNDIGVIEVGAKADLVIFDGSSPNMLGWYDPIAAIILHSNEGDITDVMVDGKFVKSNGSLLYKDYSDVKARFLQSSRKIQDIWTTTEWPATAGLFFNATPYGETEVIDTQRGAGTGY